MLSRLFGVFLLIGSVESVCFCYQRGGGRYSSAGERVLCDDIEARDECLEANKEVTDMVNSIGVNADLYLRVARRANLFTEMQSSRLRTFLSDALELGKPVGDCAVGLATNSLIKGTKSHCFSPTLLHQCDLIRSAIDLYTTNIPKVLGDKIDAALDSSTTGLTLSTPKVADFVSAMELRTNRTTANIRCESYEQTTAEINASSSVSYTAAVFVLLVIYVL